MAGMAPPEPSSPTGARLVEILLVEDSAADVELTRQALAEGEVANEIHVVKDGEAAMEFVRAQGSIPRCATPGSHPA